ncbi:twin-arginine translocation signal domain-containing protein [Methyloceanibacter marginalis]|uniref:twin-arginine translocation signal domain-containing protein n=1 Tax=Methyloceanibacter marginalis TaxID=1774971 RepID=UPI0009F6FD70
MRTGWATRREFLKGTAAAGAAGLLVSTLDFGRMAPSFAATMDPPGGWSGTPGQARYRIDGLAKVTGQKIYARDSSQSICPIGQRNIGTHSWCAPRSSITSMTVSTSISSRRRFSRPSSSPPRIWRAIQSVSPKRTIRKASILWRPESRRLISARPWRSCSTTN